MSFTFSTKKEIYITRDCSSKKLYDAIGSNIGNRNGFFDEDPEEPFFGEVKNGQFYLDLWDYRGAKCNPFHRFICNVSGSDKKSTIKLVFENELLNLGMSFLFIIIGAVIGIFNEWKFAMISLAIFYLINTIAFNIKISKCVEEIEFIADGVVLGIEDP